jgi:FkbM family methyltransferase
MSYESEIIIRNERIDNVDKWYWYEKDEGAWVGPKDDWISSHSKKYFLEVKKYDTVVQAGGCLGMYPRLLSDIFSRVYTFEPDAKNFYCLNLNCQKQNIVKFNCALGMEHKMVGLHRQHQTNLGMHMINEASNEEIPMLCIDDLALNSCDMICLDVEAYEPHVLLGAMNTINMFKPVITCENGNSTIEQLLRPLGYVEAERSISDTIYAPRN